MRHLLVLLAVSSSIYGLGCGREPETGPRHHLAGFAVLPAETFVQGPTSGQFIEGANGITPPFQDRQPVQGFSGLDHHPVEGFWAISDNGFGSQDDSADHLLRVTHLVPDFRTAEGGSGTIEVRSTVALRDPDSWAGFPIVADMERYPNGGGDVPVDGRIREERLLTGYDFDPESLCRMPDGSLWIGDEFGPFLLHADATGRLLEPPVALPGVLAPQNPMRGTATANASTSSGFEGLARSMDGATLYPMLEKPLAGEPEDLLPIYDFDYVRGGYRREQPLRKYRLSSTAHMVGAFEQLTDRRFLVVERDVHQGSKARFKRIYLVDFDAVDDDGVLLKRELVDLLRIPDPHGLGGEGAVFSFPFVTPESVIVVDEHTVGVINDNNFPFSHGRSAIDAAESDSGRPAEEGPPDASEFILIRFDAALAEIPVAL